MEIGPRHWATEPPQTVFARRLGDRATASGVNATAVVITPLREEIAPRVGFVCEGQRHVFIGFGLPSQCKRQFFYGVGPFVKPVGKMLRRWVTWQMPVAHSVSMGYSQASVGGSTVLGESQGPARGSTALAQAHASGLYSAGKSLDCQ